MPLNKPVLPFQGRDDTLLSMTQSPEVSDQTFSNSHAEASADGSSCIFRRL